MMFITTKIKIYIVYGLIMFLVVIPAYYFFYSIDTSSIKLYPVAVFADDKYSCGYIDDKGKLVIPLMYEHADNFSEGLACVGIKGKKGYINKNNVFVIQPMFNSAKPFVEGMALVAAEEMTQLIMGSGFSGGPQVYEGYYGILGYIDATGKYIVEPQYEWATEFSEGMAAVKQGDRIYYIDKHGMKNVSVKCENAGLFIQGLAKVKMNGKYGFINKKGEYVIPCKYDYVGDYSDGLAYFELIEIKEDEAKKNSFGHLKPSASLYTVKNKNIGYIDRKGNIVLTLPYDEGSRFSEGMVAVCKDGKWGFIDKNGQLNIPLKYDDVGQFSDGLAYFKEDGKYGYINKKGIIAIRPKYADANNFHNGLAVVKHKENDKSTIYINKKGEQVWPK